MPDRDLDISFFQRFGINILSTPSRKIILVITKSVEKKSKHIKNKNVFLKVSLSKYNVFCWSYFSGELEKPYLLSDINYDVLYTYRQDFFM